MPTTFSLEGFRQTLTLHVGPLVLRGGWPVVNGLPLEAGQVEIRHRSESEITLQVSAPTLGGGTFGLKIVAVEGSVEGVAETPLQIQYWLEDLPEDFVLASFGLRFTAIENMRAYLPMGYNCWDGATYQEPETMPEGDAYRVELGYAVTQILPRFGGGSVILGFDRHDRFQQTFTYQTQKRPIVLTVQTMWDRKTRTDSRCESERLILFAHPGVEEALRAWARLVAECSQLPPRVSGAGITGWSSWYNLYATISEENLLEHVHSAARLAQSADLPMRVFQIDDGFIFEAGDWLELKPQFPHGMKFLLDAIRSAGFIPGLWIAPFMVGNRSHLYRDHPDWMVLDAKTGKPFVPWHLYGEFRWHKRSEEYYILDATHPEAFAYLRKVFHTYRHEWGVDYFKTDGMFWGGGFGPDQVIHHQPGMTRVEIFLRVLKMIREEIGADTPWLGCGCPLWPSIGFVDGIRISGDIGVDWDGLGFSAQSLLRDQVTRNFTNNILWQIDPDSVLLRERYHNLTDAEVRSLALYAGMSAGVIMTSDDLGDLGPERIRLWKLILNPARRSCRFPLLGQTAISYIAKTDVMNGRQILKSIPNDPVLVQVRDLQATNDPTNGPGAVAAALFLNTGEQTVQRSYPLSLLGLPEPLYVFDWTSDQPWPAPVDTLAVTLAPHDSALLFLSSKAILSAPEKLI
jgi:alpha-galactosidase